jgi:hypothetical protein
MHSEPQLHAMDVLTIGLVNPSAILNVGRKARNLSTLVVQAI